MILSSIHIGNTNFKITEDAKDILVNYKYALQQHLKNFKDASLIITELEYKLSELLIPYVKDEFDFLSELEVIECIEILGTPEGFELPKFKKNTNFSTDFDQKKSFSLVNNVTLDTIKEFFHKLYRDTDRQQIGGVAAGIAHILNTDPLWIRLLCLFPLMVLGTSKVPLVICFLGYLTLWMLLPEQRNIKRNQNTRLFFRDKENQVIAGISSGLSNYLGINIHAIRITFLLLAYFYKPFILLYIVIWVVTPYSRTLKDKFQSKGKAFNLEEIENYLTKTLQDNNINQETIQNAFNKVGQYIGNINVSPFLFELLKIVSFVFGAILFIISISMIFIGFPALGIALKLIPLHDVMTYVSSDINNEILTDIDRNLLMTIQYSIPNTTAIISLIQLLSVVSLTLILSVGLMTFKKVVKTTPIIFLLVLSVISSILLFTALNMSVHNFDNQATHKEEVFIPIKNGFIDLQYDKVGKIGLNEVDIDLDSYDGKDLKLVFLQEGLGKTRENAIKNAKAIDYLSMIKENKVILSSHFSFPRGAKYRKQKLKLKVFIPEGVPFKVNKDLSQYLSHESIHIVNADELLVFNHHDIDVFTGNLFSFQTPRPTPTPSRPKSYIEYKKFKNTLDSVIVYGNINLHLKVDHRVKGSIVKYKKDNNNPLNIKKIGNSLRVYPSENKNNFTDIVIMTNNIELLKFEGTGDLRIDEPVQIDSLAIKLAGNVKADIYDLSAKFTAFDLSGAAELDVNGNCDDVLLMTNGGSIFNGQDFKTKDIKAKAKGVSEINIHASNNATIFQSTLSKVTISGNPNHLENHTQR